MSDYKPSLSAARNAYSNGSADRISQQGADAEFERFIAKIKAEAWDEGAMASESLSCENPPCGVCEHCGTPLDNPYRREP